MGEVSDSNAYFETRLPYDNRREILWRSLHRFYFRRLISPSATVIDLGCGYGHFINNATARRRIAVDLWSEAAKFLDPAVEFHRGSITDLSFLEDGALDVAFASNVFEHLSQSESRSVLTQLAAKLRPGGRLIVVQPNYRYAYREYFDDYTHVSVHSHVSFCDFLAASHYVVTRCEPRFMPLTVKSRMPVIPWLVWAYLRSPFKPWGKQMLLVAEAPALVPQSS